MKLKIFSLIFLGLFFQGTTAFGKTLYFVKNNQKLVIPSEKEFSDLDAKLQALLNKYYGGQSLVIRVQFIDAEDDNVFSSLIEWLGLIKKEDNLIDPSVCQDLEIVFEWRNNAWSYKEIAFAQSELIESRFLPKVREFVNEYGLANLTTEREIIRKWLVIIHNVLDQQWKEKLLSEGQELVGVQGYQRGHRLAHWMKPDYMYDLEPHSTDSASATKVTYISNAKASNKEYKEYEFMPTLVKWLSAFEYHNPYSNISEVEDRLFERVRDREDYINKKPNHDLVTSKIVNDTSFHKKSRDNLTKLYRLKLVELPIRDNEEYNLLSDLARFWWKHTTWNFFAFDLQKKTFGRYLWPLSCAFGSTAISDYLPTDPNFKEITLGEISKYSSAGFFITCVKPGHVATIYPNDDRIIVKANNEDIPMCKLVQAGAYVGKDKYLNQVWPNLTEVRYYIYLGHLLF